MSDVVEVTRDEIAAGLRRLGLAAGDGVIVHSSLSSFGRVAGGAEAVIDALQAVITEAGTVMMPTFSHGLCYREGEAGYFEPLATPTPNGAIPEAFRRRGGVCRSWHPTHAFAAWGRKAAEYTRLHHRTLCCGRGSPLGLLWADGGWGLLLGVDYRSNTFHHVVETCTGAPCLGRRTTALAMKLPDGRIVEGRTWSWRDAGCPIDDPARYGQVMASRGLQRETAIGACRAIAFRLSDCYEVVAELLGNGLGDLPPCSRCPVRPRRTGRSAPSDWDDARQCLKPDSPALDY